MVGVGQETDILIVDDEADICHLVKGILQDEGYTCRLASNSSETYEQLQRRCPHLVILDIWLHGSDHDGMQILDTIQQKYPYVPVVMISGHGTIETAVSAIKRGAYDFVEKPFKSDRLLLMIKRALETADLRRENEFLKQSTEKVEDLIGHSPVVQNLRQVLRRVAPTNSRVFLTGEPGTGKDIAARVIHHNSARADKPFLVLNCATLRPEHLEAELFGLSESHDEEGEIKQGVLERAHGGTLLLDEVADMPLETQGKILRVLQEQRFSRVGGNQQIEVDVRVMATSNRDLDKAMGEGRLRQDLFYRLNVVPIHMPALRERSQDMPKLIEHFSKILSVQLGVPMRLFSPEAMRVMQSYDWPGNIRQLKNVLEWIAIMNDNQSDGPVTVEQLPPDLGGRQEAIASPVFAEEVGSGDGLFLEFTLREAREAFERRYLQSQIDRFEGNVSKTAKYVGMERSALHRKLKSLDILTGDRDAEQDNVKLKRA